MLQWAKECTGIEGAGELKVEGARKDPEWCEIDGGWNGAGTPYPEPDLQPLDEQPKVSRAVTQRSMRMKDAGKAMFEVSSNSRGGMGRTKHKGTTREIGYFLWEHSHGIYWLGDF